MGALALKFLGDLEIARDGKRLELPPSRKTRALLAYLVLTGRSFRREHLCELLWEIPDDPRGSLRWSLSKLRRLVDDEGRERVVADRLTVRFDATDVSVDVAALAAIAQGKLDAAPLEELESAAARSRSSVAPLSTLEARAWSAVTSMITPVASIWTVLRSATMRACPSSSMRRRSLVRLQRSDPRGSSGISHRSSHRCSRRNRLAFRPR
ncbi:MAG TPA: hypothetical protein VF405_04910 [Gammaproteobacteria bacterium]